MRKLENALYVLVCLLLCFMPTAFLLCGYENPNYERRALALLPEEYTLDYSARFDAWFKDHFALRDVLVTGCNALSLGLLGEAVNAEVVAGSDGWLFFAPTLRDYTRTQGMDALDIARAAKSLQLMQDYAASNGADFVFTVAPNKNSIYPEMMPAYIKRGNAAKNASRLYAALDALGVPYVDLESALLADKGMDSLYYSNDTHWNERGACTAYRALMRAVAGEAYYDAYENAAFSVAHDYSGDLHYFVRPAAKGEGEAPRLIAARSFVSEKPFDAERDLHICTSADTNELHILMYRDSFGVGLIPYISANAGSAVYSLAFPYDLTLIDEELPTVVIVERVERNLPDLAKSTPRLTPKAAAPTQTPASGLMAAAVQKQEGRRVKVMGRFAHEKYEPLRDRVLLSVDGKQWYEAFPVMEEDAEGISGFDQKLCWGFGLYLPEGTQAQTLCVCVETPEGCISSQPLILRNAD